MLTYLVTDENRLRSYTLLSWCVNITQDVIVGCTHKENAAPVAKDSQLNAFTLAAIGALACIAADMVHEGVGHGTASLLMSDPILSLSTVAIQNASPSRFVSAAGTT